MPRKKAPDLRHITATELHPLAVPLSSLTLDPDNERVHSREGIDRLKYIFVTLGIREPLAIRYLEGVALVTCGNGTLMAMRELAEDRAIGEWQGAPKGPLAWDHTPVLEFDDDEKTAATYRILSNAASKDPVDDPEAIAETVALWPEVDWAAGGWGPEAIAEARAGWGDIPNFGDPAIGVGGDGDGPDGDGPDGAGSSPVEDPEDDVIPETPVDPITQPGDIWFMGDHRLICGSCRDPEIVARLLDGEKINVAFTSPPYASQRKYDESSGFKPIPPDEYVEWFESVQANVREHLADDGSWFVNIKAASRDLDTETYVLDLVLAHVRMWGWHWGAEFTWERIGMPGRPRRRFKNQHEPVHHFARGDWKFRPKSVQTPSNDVPKYDLANHWSKGLRDDDTPGQSGDGWVEVGPGMAYPGNRLPVFGVGNETKHSASFPIGLPTFFIKAYSDPGDIIFDPFEGSGTGIIASEREGRRGYGCEISPRYCDVSVIRWETETGRKAQRFDAHGVEFEGIPRAA